MTKQPDLSVPEIADLLNVSTGSIYQQVARMRKAGHLPKARKAPKPAATTVAPTPEPRPEPEPRTEPQVESVEEHLAIEINDTDERLAYVAETLATLTAEGEALTERKGRLERAHAALTSAADTAPLAAVA